MSKFRAAVTMKKPWVSEWLRKPTKDNILETLADEILSGNIDEIFEIIVEEIE